jgi:hypothetical protein
MESTIKRRLAIGAAGLAVLGGAGGTYAATQDGSGTDERKAFVNDAAKRLDVSPGKLQSALRGAFEDRLNAAVKSGRLTKAEADEIKRHAGRHGGPPGPGPLGVRHRGPGPPGIEAATKYLGLSPARLHARLRAGKSLADIARERGKSVEGLKDALRKAFDARVDTFVERDGPGPGPGMGHRGIGPPPPPF